MAQRPSYLIRIVNDGMKSFLDFSPSELKTLFAEWNLPPFRLVQVRRWVFSRKTFDFDAMSDLPKEIRTRLSAFFSPNILAGQTVVHRTSGDATEKLLLEWPDGNRVECVLLRDNRKHRTACVSTQVGCAMGCAFCAGGLDGFVRNLSRGEILEQILRLNALLPPPERLTHLVVMGTGEPLLNLDNLLTALEETVASDGLDLGGRRITISTVGIPAGIDRLAESGKPYKLAVSLHAPEDSLRNDMIPQNRHSGIRAILEASDRYFASIGRRVTFEYILIADLNDGPVQAKQLIRLLRGRTAVVNLIPFNPVPELSYRTPSPGAVKQFAELLEQGGVQVKTRFRKGDRIDAACGQLRRSRRDGK